MRIHCLCREHAKELVENSVDAACRQEHGHDRAECADEDSRKRCFAGSGQQQRKRHDRQHHNIIDDDAHKYDLPYFQTIISGRGKDLKITVPSLYAEYRKHRNQAHQNRDEIDSACDREPGDQLCPNGFPSAILGRKNDCVCACLIFISEDRGDDDAHDQRNQQEYRWEVTGQQRFPSVRIIVCDRVRYFCIQL